MEEKKKNTADAAAQSKIAAQEEKTLDFWRENKIFEKTLEATRDNEPFVFYDGPPFATGLPHYGHLLQGVLKDAVPRFQTMHGRYVRRVWGWDCHGLPVENLIEKELGLEHKKDIETYGVEKFNQAAKDSVLRYDADWKKIVPRMGRWIDMGKSYKTMDWKYTESIWWAFKTLHEKGLVYEGYKPMHICPRCETTLASSEVTLNYQDVKDISVTVKFELEDEPNTFVLAWTTTPWTLPGNVALAVSKGIEYAEWEVRETDSGKKERYIVASERANAVFDDELFGADGKPNEHFVSGKNGTEREYTFIKKLYGEELVGKRYRPVFEYFSNDEKLENRENGWKIYDADFVTIDTGTGVVHIAPAFGEDDMNLGKEKALPFIQHVKMDGTFTSEVTDFAGMPVKKKGDTQSADIEIIKHLAGKGTLFSKLKIEHSYPMCWRCDTPLLNYATSSWFVKVTAIRDEMSRVNKEVTWIPETMRDGRFGKWVEGARDWAISRSRYWGAPIPVWRCEDCAKIKVIGSVADLKAAPRNRYFGMRHGEAESNVRYVVSSRVENTTSLTEKGKEEVALSAEKLKDKNIDYIFASDFVRTKQTAEIVAEVIGVSKDKIIFDERLREVNTGDFNGKSVEEYHAFFASRLERFTKRPEGGENIRDVRRRVMDFLFDIDAKHEGKNILIVTHESPVWMMDTTIAGYSDEEASAIKEGTGFYSDTASVREIAFAPYPHNQDFEIDLHRPYIDEATASCACGGKAKRVSEVFDCWFESGSMPYAQFHYPFENEKEFERQFPAEFIAEAVDQTRGWFYNMLALSVGLFEKSPFQNVITTGLILSEDGKQKLSKKLKNYPDPVEVINKYGADALRLYMISSPIVHGEDLSFSEKGVDEVYKKVIVRLQNVLSFYELYKNENGNTFPKSEHILDQWIFARLGELNILVTQGMNEYKIDAAVRPIAEFIDDLSTWYLQNSRERLKGKDGSDEESQSARETLRYVLEELSKIIAPFMPFVAEEVYQKVSGAKESVHLESWPTEDENKNDPVLLLMEETRKIVSIGLEARAKGAIKVRQPLKKITLKKQTEALFETPIADAFLSLIAERVNVKEVAFGEIDEDAVLDFEITSELKEEGNLRELIRTIQELRKKEDLNPNDREQTLVVSTNADGKHFIKKWEDEIKKATLFAEVVNKHLTDGEVAEIEDMVFLLAVKKD